MKKIYILIYLSIIFSMNLYSDSFQQGNLEFSNKNYSEAETLYLEDLETNGNDLNSLFNLSNVYIKQDKLGHALYYLYIARIYKPNDINIKNEIRVIEESLNVKGQYKYLIPISNINLIRISLTILFLLTGSLFVITLLNYLNLKENIFFRLRKIISYVLFLLFLLTTLGLISNKLDQNSGINLNTSNVTVSPYLGSEKSFTITPGLKIKIKDEFEDYYFITDNNNRYGWIEKQNIGLIWRK